MSQVIIVSNRLPVTVSLKGGKLKFESSAGGMSGGLSSIVKSSHNKWIGWPGMPCDELTQKHREQIIKELAKRHCVPVFLTKQQVDDFYSGYSNSLLWPLIHNLPRTEPGPRIHARWWKTYRQVNELFAAETMPYTSSTSTIWVHDYQLMLVPELLRNELPNNHIGFFLHTPFPNYRTFNKIGEAKRLVGGVLGADLVGFHTPSYVEHFTENVEKFNFGHAEGDQLVLGERTIRMTKFPIGIDYNKFTSSRKLPAVKEAAKVFKTKYKGKKVIAGVDRLDITKGFVERLVAYRDFLERNPKQRGKVIFALVGAPSRGDVVAYQRLGKRVNKLVAEINEAFGNKRWQPVDYMNETIPFEQVSGLFQVADVAFIAPVRDGMNLVAKEYIASRRKNGILILSQTAGAAEELQDALLVDLKKPETLVAALEQALTMRKREIRRRFLRMQDRVATQTISKWSKDFMGTLRKPPVPVPAIPLRSPLVKRLLTAYDRAPERVLFLDYDGTLAELATRPEDAKPTPEVKRILKKLAKDPNTDVFVVSGRSRNDLDNWLGGTGVGFIAEHGAFQRSPGRQRWQTSEALADTSWKALIRPAMEKYARLTPGAHVEEKSAGLVWHYRESPAYTAKKNLVVLRSALKPILEQYGLRAHAGKKILEVKPKNINKGAAVKAALQQTDYRFVLTAGDDYTDESMFRAVPRGAYSIKVGSGTTKARYRTKDVASMVRLLGKLAG
ncbi:MAG: hypothetical protein JWN38_637 [Candidatus Saccharibacteria bacterium]|nr:hypothetical protein [Candidatus Saccharibacteria bacterium]